MPLGVRVFARPMRYFSLARRTLSRLSLSLSSGVLARSWMVCAGLQKCSATPDLSPFVDNVSSVFVKSVFKSSASLSDVLAVFVSVM